MASLYANIAQVGRPADLAALLRPGYDAAGAPDQCDGLWNCRRHPADLVAFDSRDPGHGRRRTRAAAVGPRAWPPQFFAPPWRPSIVRQTHPSPADKISYRLVFRQTAYRAPADANAIDADQEAPSKRAAAAEFYQSRKALRSVNRRRQWPPGEGAFCGTPIALSRRDQFSGRSTGHERTMMPRTVETVSVVRTLSSP